MLSQISRDMGGCTIDCAKNGVEAVEMAVLNRYDVIFMDVQMPLKDGITAMHEIRHTLDYYIPIIAVTARVHVGDRTDLLSKGFTGFIAKPIERSELTNMLNSLKPYGEVSQDEEPPAQLRGSKHSL